VKKALQPTKTLPVRKDPLSELMTIHPPRGSDHLDAKSAANGLNDRLIRQKDFPDNGIRVNKGITMFGEHPRRRCFSAANATSQTQDHWR
jgi:hypothetical protein